MSDATQPPAGATPPPRRRTEAEAPTAIDPVAAAPIGSANYPTILDAVNAGDVVWVLQRLYLHPEECNEHSPENGWMPLHVAVMNGNFRMAEVLLRFGAEANAANNAGKNALHDAAGKGQSAMVQLLLEYGADPSIAYKDETAAQRALKAGHADLAALLEAKAAG